MPRVPGMSGRSPILRIVITLVVIAAGSVGACFKTRGHGSSRSPNPSTPSHSTPSRSTPSRSTQRERPAANVDVTNGLVTHVADGDTIDVDLDDADPAIRVRLLGIDSPELEGPTASFGNAAREWIRPRVEHQRVTLEFDGPTPKYDKYGRMLAYVYTTDGHFVNEDLVRAGEAFAHRTLTCGQTTALVAAEDQARAAKRGFWPTMTVGLMPPWRQRWLGEHPQ